MQKSQTSYLRLPLLSLFLLALPVLSQPIPAVTSHEKVAHEFYFLLGGSNIATAGAEAILYGVISANPQLADYQGVIRDWYQKLLSNRELEPDISQLYMKNFSEKEMKDLIGFYHTPLGKKALNLLPGIFKQTLIIAVKHVEGHSPELEEQLGKALMDRDPEGVSDEIE